MDTIKECWSDFAHKVLRADDCASEELFGTRMVFYGGVISALELVEAAMASTENMESFQAKFSTLSSEADESGREVVKRGLFKLANIQGSA